MAPSREPRVRRSVSAPAISRGGNTDPARKLTRCDHPHRAGRDRGRLARRRPPVDAARRVPRARGRDPARAVGLHALHPRQPAVRRADRRRRLGARLGHRPRRAARVRAPARPRPAALVAVLALFLGVAILRAVGIVARRLGAGVMQYRMQAPYRREVTRQYLRLPMAWHQRHPTGQLLSNANSDVEAAWAPIAPLPMAVGTLAMMVIAIAPDAVHRRRDGRRRAARLPAGDGRQRRLPAAVLADLHPHPGAARRAQRDRARVLRRRDGGQDAGAGDRGDRALRGPRPTSSATRASGPAGSGRRSTRCWRACPTSASWSCSASGCWRVSTQTADAGDVVTVAYLLMIVAFPIRSIGWLVGEFPRSVVGYQRVRRVLDERQRARRTASRRCPTAPPTRPAPASRSTTSATPTSPASGCSTTSTSWSSPDARWRVVGATASGKSTLTTLLMRLVDPDTGAIRVDGIDLRDLARGAAGPRRRHWCRRARSCSTTPCAAT